MTKERLELLSDDVIKSLAKKVGVRIKLDWDRCQIINSIIDVMDEDREEKESLLNLAVSIESKKYAVTIDEELDLSYDFDEEMVLPDRYNENMVKFLLRDNTWGFILWDINDAQYQNYVNQFGELNIILRVNELKNGIFSKESIIDFFDIEVEKKERRRYVNLPHEESYYFVEVILSTEFKEITINRSNVVKTSRDHVNYALNDNGKIKSIVELSGFEFKDLSKRRGRNFNRILPFDTIGEDE